MSKGKQEHGLTAIEKGKSAQRWREERDGDQKKGRPPGGYGEAILECFSAGSEP